jgi:L-rhamnose mutarotase
MKRHVLMTDLKDDPAVIMRYREYHDHVWPEVLQSLRAVGVAQMEIYILGRRLVMIMELADGLDLRRAFARHSASSPRVAEWERLMRSMQEPPPGVPPSDWWSLMEPVFRLNEQEPAVVHADRSRTS